MFLNRLFSTFSKRHRSIHLYILWNACYMYVCRKYICFTDFLCSTWLKPIIEIGRFAGHHGMGIWKKNDTTLVADPDPGAWNTWKKLSLNDAAELVKRLSADQPAAQHEAFFVCPKSLGRNARATQEWRRNVRNGQALLHTAFLTFVKHTYSTHQARVATQMRITERSIKFM